MWEVLKEESYFVSGDSEQRATLPQMRAVCVPKNIRIVVARRRRLGNYGAFSSWRGVVLVYIASSYSVHDNGKSRRGPDIQALGVGWWASHLDTSVFTSCGMAHGPSLITSCA